MTDNINKGVQENTEKATIELFNGNALVFGIIKSHKATLNAQITDNFVEDNFAIHDHIAISPIVVTLSGLVGDAILTSEVANQQAQNELELAKQRQRLSGDFFKLPNYIDTSSMVVTKLGSLSMLMPQMSNITQMAVNMISYAYQSAQNTIINKWNNRNQAVLNNTPINNNQQTKIQQAYEQLKNTFYSREPNTVYTPWTTYENMYIQSIEITQDEMNYVVDLSVTLKQLKFSSVQYGEVNQQVRDAYNSTVTADEENGGKARMNSIRYDRKYSGMEYKNL